MAQKIAHEANEEQLNEGKNKMKLFGFNHQNTPATHHVILKWLIYANPIKD